MSKINYFEAILRKMRRWEWAFLMGPEIFIWGSGNPCEDYPSPNIAFFDARENGVKIFNFFIDFWHRNGYN